MGFIQKLVRKAEDAAQLARAADIGKLTKAAENMAKKVTPAAEHQESEENFHPEHKKYFSAPKI